ncbi:hypothetical protein P280DRAFT_121611 [Massarina eburnea CBS 473.64]|uniref:Uncharacterized protein n=1 Tax=Massarina eburnea CBS 473.64 TaxID=1395130 RepID=A0A6A6SF49_9PLEO|nr:hypothetical protein P280DRAFT_121611 [Massarina eburnea CBS 473.64]
MPYIFYPPPKDISSPPHPSSPMSLMTAMLLTRNADSPIYAIPYPDPVDEIIVCDLRSSGWRIVEHELDDPEWRHMIEKYKLEAVEERGLDRIPGLLQVCKDENTERNMGTGENCGAEGRGVEEKKATKLIKHRRDSRSDGKENAKKENAKKENAKKENAKKENAKKEKEERERAGLSVIPWMRQKILCGKKEARSRFRGRLSTIEEDAEPWDPVGVRVTREIILIKELNIGLAALMDVNIKKNIWPVDEPPVKGEVGQERQWCSEADWTYKVTCAGVSERVLARIGPVRSEQPRDTGRTTGGPGFSQGKILPGCTLEEIEGIRLELLRD